MSIAKMKAIDDVKQFWDTSPLFSDEYQGTVGSPEILDYHEKVIVDDIMAVILTIISPNIF